MVSLTFGVESLTALLITKSARWGVSVALAVSLPASGSDWSLSVMVAVLVWASGLTTLAVTVRVALPPLRTEPTSHSPVAGVYDPWLGLSASYVRPAGNR